MPSPRAGESESDFVGRCIPQVIQDGTAENQQQAAAICYSMWRERNVTINDKLLTAIKSRKSPRELFGCGIRTADAYVRTLQECVGIDACNKYASTRSNSFDDILRKAAKTLVYRNQDMGLEKEVDTDIFTTAADFPQVVGKIQFKQPSEGDDSIELPKNTLMVFRHILTTPRKDRDGDILRTQGAVVDPKMLLLWQHVHTLPVGKMLGVAEHTSRKLSLVSCIVDLNELSHDAAVMVDNGMARFSHGFRALEFEQLKEEEGELTSPGGFDVKGFEIMEGSIVSVPSNVDAEVEEVILDLVEGGKLTSGIMKEVGTGIRSRRLVAVRGIELESDDEGNKTTGCTCEGKTGAPAEKDDGPGEGTKATEATEPEEVKGAQRITPGSLRGSWEYIEKALCNLGHRYLGSTVNMADRFLWTVGTFPDHVIYCAEHHSTGVPDEFLYYKVAWAEKEGGDPELKGEPSQVEIEFTAEEISARSPYIQNKDGQKVGARLNRSIRQAIADVRDDIGELVEKEEGMSRGGKAMCERCYSKLTDVLGMEGEEATEYSAKDVMEFLLAASDEDVKLVAEMVEAQKELLHLNSLQDEYSALSAVDGD